MTSLEIVCYAQNVDDKNFDQTVALEWIRVIEDPSARVREKDIYPYLSTWLSQTSTKNALDIGCGQGVCSAQLKGSPIQYVGVDASPELIHRAKELYSDSTRTFVTGNAYDLPFKDKHFDAAFSIAVWHLLSDISKASSELSRILRQDGRFLIVTADPDQYQTWMEKYQDRKFDGCVFTGTNQNPDGSQSTDTLYLRPLEKMIESLQTHGLHISTTQIIRSSVVISGYKG